jgi:hypothetical protein
MTSVAEARLAVSRDASRETAKRAFNTLDGKTHSSIFPTSGSFACVQLLT